MKAKILLVDDEELILISWKYILMSEGYEVKTVSNGIDAIEIAREQKPDLVITDLFMSVIDGIEVCRRIKKKHPEALIILVSGHPDLEETDKYKKDFIRAGGEDCFLIKPLSKDEIIRAVEMVKL